MMHVLIEVLAVIGAIGSFVFLFHTMRDWFSDLQARQQMPLKLEAFYKRRDYQ